MILLTVLGLLLVGVIALFYGLQQYIVYDQSGVRLELPYMRQEPEEEQPAEATPEPTFEPVPVTIVYDPPDFSDIDLAGWEGLEPTKALFVPFSDVKSDSSRSTAIANASYGFTGLVLELKDRSGKLAWNSASAIAQAYGASGSMELAPAVAEIHEAGLTAAAQISCCADELMATRNWPITLQQDGRAYQDADGVYWLDPYSRQLCTYLTELMVELAGAGFDEIILADIYHPISEEPFTYSSSQLGEPDPVIAVCQMARRLVTALDGSGTPISMKLDSTSLRQRDAARTGQELSILWRIFARLYCRSGTDTVASDLELACESMTEGSASVRFVPVLGLIPEGVDSFVISW